jgi:HSP20 family protein
MMPARDVFDYFVQDPWRMFDGDRFGPSTIAVDLRETNDAYVVEAELPGVRPEDTEVTLEGRTLTMRARYDESREEGGQGERFLLRERRSGEMTRSVTLPGGIDADKVTTSFEHGELRITLPKAAEMRARRIPIGSGPTGTKPVGPRR